MRIYASDPALDDPCLMHFAVHVTGENATKILRRYLAFDVLKLQAGSFAFSPVLNAMGFVTDLVLVVRDGAEAYRVFAHFSQSVAWLFQMNRAFDAEIETLEGASRLVFDPQGEYAAPRLSPEGATVVPVGKASFVFAPEGGEPEGQSLPQDACASLCRDAGFPVAAGLEDGQKRVTDAGLSHLVDLSDKSRMFIGRALTEEFLKISAAS